MLKGRTSASVDRRSSRSIAQSLLGVVGLGLGATAALGQGVPAETRFSQLAEIDAANVGRLVPAFSFRTGSPGGHAGAPVVAGRLLVLQTPFPHTIYALDLAEEGRVRRTYRPAPDRMAEGLATEDAVNAGPAIAGDRVYLTTLDGHVTCLDLETGRVVWDAAPARTSRGETLAGTPLVTGGRVVVGTGGDAFGARGWIAALDPATGREVWRRHSAGPDEDVGIGADLRTPEAESRDAGVRSWPPGGWEHGGGLGPDPRG